MKILNFQKYISRSAYFFIKIRLFVSILYRAWVMTKEWSDLLIIFWFWGSFNLAKSAWRHFITAVQLWFETMFCRKTAGKVQLSTLDTDKHVFWSLVISVFLHCSSYYSLVISFTAKPCLCYSYWCWILCKPSAAGWPAPTPATPSPWSTPPSWSPAPVARSIWSWIPLGMDLLSFSSATGWLVFILPGMLASTSGDLSR